MCIIFAAFRSHPNYELVLAANRDEFFERPSAPADFWPDAPTILAGRDLLEGGTWMGITRDGRLAALTNIRRKEDTAAPGRLSRGLLVSAFLQSGLPSDLFLKAIQSHRKAYKPYNILLQDKPGRLAYYSNATSRFEFLSPGIYGLSNHYLDTPWPKVDKGKERFKQILSEEYVDREQILHLLSDSDPAPDSLLPSTGVGLELERTLSPIFIKSPDYGTRCSTIITVDKHGFVQFTERSYLDYGHYDRVFHFQIS